MVRRYRRLETFKIDLDIDGDNIIHRPDLKDCSPKPEAIAKTLKVSKEVLTALFDTRHFLSLHPDEKKRVVFDLLGLNVTRSNIKKRLKSWLKEQPGVLEKYQIDPDEDLISLLGTTPDSLKMPTRRQLTREGF